MDELNEIATESVVNQTALIEEVTEEVELREMELDDDGLPQLDWGIMAQFGVEATSAVEKDFAVGEGFAKTKLEEGQTLEQHKSVVVGSKTREGAETHKEPIQSL